MKRHLLQPLFVFSFFLFMVSVSQAQGPDAFGYTWKTSDDVDGPVFDWIDITSVGTEVEGLADDNAVGPIPMGMDFHFYWSDFSEVKFGSNGWLSFDNVSNIASCFPVIPTADGKDNLICPLMSDLNFANGSSGKIYTYHDGTPGDEKFIISYENVSHWTQGNPIFGSNTFQVILSNADSSITFQYATMEPDFAYTCTGSGKVAVGIENLTGEIGLEVFSGVMPPSDFAVKFYFPEVITLEIFDAAPTSNQNPENEGVFLVSGDMVTLTSTISNTGNTDITSDIAVGATVLSFDGTTVYSDVQGITTGLAAGMEQVISFTTTEIDWTPDSYSYIVQTDNNDDVNPNNNQNTTELNVIDISEERTALSYISKADPSGIIQWAGGGNGDSGGGIEIEPPFYPFTLVAVEANIAGGSTDGFTFRVFDDDGSDGGPGTELAFESIPPGGYTPADWNQYELETPVTITDGTFYLGWYMEGNTIALTVQAAPPLSNRSYEILSGSWAKYRSPADIMLRAIAENPFFVGTEDIVDDSRLQVFPNPNDGTFQIDNTQGNLTIENLRVMNTLGAVVFEQQQDIPIGGQFVLETGLNAGLYYLELRTEDQRRVVRKVLVD